MPIVHGPHGRRRRNPPLSEHLAHDDLHEIARLFHHRLAGDPSDAAELVLSMVRSTMAGLDEVPPEGEYAQHDAIMQALVNAERSLTQAVTMMHGRANPRSRRRKNPRAPANAPDEVKQVAEAMVQSAAEAGSSEKRVSVRHRFDNSWSLTDNYEQVPIIMIYRDGQWSIRDFEGEEAPMRGGFSEAMENASIFFTG